MRNFVNSYLAAHHHTAICVADWNRSVAFYERLGFQVQNDWFWPDGTRNHKSLLRFRDRADCWLELFEYPEGAGTLTSRFRMAAGSVYTFALSVYCPEDVDALYRWALEAGGTSVSCPHEERWRGEKGMLSVRSAVVAGPDGEPLTFHWDENNPVPDACAVSSRTERIRGFHHNAVRVSDLERSIQFYEKLGFDLQDIYRKDDSVVRFALLVMENGSGLMLREESEGVLPTDTERLRTPGGLFQYCFRVDEPEGIDAIYGYCVGLGAKERIRPFWHDGYGMKHWVDHPAFVYGPDDEILEFLYIDYGEAP